MNDIPYFLDGVKEKGGKFKGMTLAKSRKFLKDSGYPDPRTMRPFEEKPVEKPKKKQAQLDPDQDQQLQE